jgi:hypothetical protein
VTYDDSALTLADINAIANRTVPTPVPPALVFIWQRLGRIGFWQPTTIVGSRRQIKISAFIRGGIYPNLQDFTRPIHTSRIRLPSDKVAGFTLGPAVKVPYGFSS